MRIITHEHTTPLRFRLSPSHNGGILGWAHPTTWVQPIFTLRHNQQLWWCSVHTVGHPGEGWVNAALQVLPPAEVMSFGLCLNFCCVCSCVWQTGAKWCLQIRTEDILCCNSQVTNPFQCIKCLQIDSYKNGYKHLIFLCKKCQCWLPGNPSQERTAVIRGNIQRDD